MSGNPARGRFDPIPSTRVRATLSVETALPPVSQAAALAVPVAQGAEPPAHLGADAARLAVAGFTAASNQTLVLAGDDGRALVALGIGDGDTVDLATVRDLAADFARAVPQHKTLAVELPEGELAVSATDFAQVVVEGVLLARWRYFVGKGGDEPTLTALTLVAPEHLADEVREGVRRGDVVARAAAISRDLSNCPATTLTAVRMAEVAEELAPGAGLEVEVFDEDQLIEMGCGGILGVNLGSVDEPRLVRLRYRPERPTGRLALIGKGIMYDSGGISLKPSDESHAQMKNDMTGAAAILGAMTALRDLGCSTEVTAYLCCTDNMPSGSAMKLGDVLTMRNGKTVEVLNTDAEGRLVMADGLSLATEEPVDAIVDIATLTGACLRALGVEVAGVMGNNAALIGQLEEAGGIADEPVWELPLYRPYRRQLDSSIADLTNMGGRERRLDHRGPVPGGVRRRPPLGARRHRRHRAATRRPDLAQQGRQRVRRQAADRARPALPATGGGRRMSAEAEQESSGGGFLGWIERIGNKIPHPAMIFLGLIFGVIILSAILSWAGVSVTTEVAEAKGTTVVQTDTDAGSTYPSIEHPPEQPVPDYELKHETIKAKSLLSADGIRHMFTTVVQNFNDFGVVAVILVAMIGVGVAEEAGLIAALIRKMVQVAPAAAITFIIVLLGGISSVASDAGLPGADPVGGGGVRQHGTAPAGRHRRGLRRGQRGVLRQHPDHSGRRDHHRGQQRDHRRGRAERAAR